MQDLRIVGLDEENDPPRLMLSDEAGADYALPVDEALRAAVGRTPGASPSGTAASESATGAAAPKPSLSPREIQARLRAGATIEQVVEASGQSRDHVLRYAGPVADERVYIATLARQTVIASASTTEHHRVAFGDSPATLEAMVRVRLRAMDVPLSSLSWDAWRREDGRWAITCSFDISSSSTHAEGIGLKPPAEWAFDTHTRSLRAENKWAESLSQLDTSEVLGSGQRSGRRLAAVDEPFDVDRGPAGVTSSSPRRAGHTSTRGRGAGPDRAADPSVSPLRPSNEADDDAGQGTDTEDLLDILRARRGQRLGTDESGDDKLATLLTRDEQPRSSPHSIPDQDAAHRPSRPVRAGADSPRHRAAENPGEKDRGEGESGDKDRTGHGRPESHGEPAAETHRPARRRGEDDDLQHTGPIPGLEEQLDHAEEPGYETGTDAWGFSYEDTGDDVDEPAPSESGRHAPEPEDSPHRPSEPSRKDQESSDTEKRRRSSKSKRPSMPRWDDILFGSKNE